jgi:uncharacterized membrane protein YoaK (UPF0700 family)
MATGTKRAKRRAGSSTLRATWREQKRWSRAADRARRRYARWRTASLALMVAAAIAGALAAQLEAEPAFVGAALWLAGAAGVAAALVAVIGRSMLGPAKMREWIRARSASEGLKSEVYKFVMRAGPYREGDPEASFAERIADITDAMKDLDPLLAAIEPEEREPPEAPMNVDDYLDERLSSQIDGYYRKQAATEARIVARYRVVELSFTSAAAILGAIAAVEGASIAAWVAAATTAATAVGAHLAAGRHEYELATYTATARRLERLATRFRDASEKREPTAAEIDTLVTEAEAAISAEHQGWMTEWEKPEA